MLAPALQACANTKEKAHAKAAEVKRAKKARKGAKQRKGAQMITEAHDASAMHIQAVERGRMARIRVKAMRRNASLVSESKHAYLPKMNMTDSVAVHWADEKVRSSKSPRAACNSGESLCHRLSAVQLQAPVVKIQAAARRRLARRRVERKRAADEAEYERLLLGPAAAPAVAVPRFQHFWDSNGNPMPAWLESLPALEYSLDDLKQIRALRKVSCASDG